MMDFSRDFFEYEIRNGYFVPSMMKRTWAAQLEVLNIVDRICEKHGITWHSDFGTLLGAVRHEGFIPWDDDIDICMLRDDYDRFLKIVSDELPEGFILKTMYDEDNPFYELFARVVNLSGWNGQEGCQELLHGFGFPSGIDIFPLDYINNDVEAEDARYNILEGLSASLTAVEKGELSEALRLIDAVEALTDYRIDRELPVKQQIYICLDVVGKQYTKDVSEYVTLVPYYLDDRNYKCRLEAFDKVIKLPFEGLYLNAPVGYEDVLRCEFGDYMRLVVGGGDHEYPFYRKLEAEVYGDGARPRFYYRFEPSQLDNVEGASKMSLSRRLKSIAASMKKVCTMLEKLIDLKDAVNILELLEKMQTAAINTGEYIEEKAGLETASVPVLEELCEELYQLYAEYMVGKEPGMGKVSELVEGFAKTSAEEFADYKEVVFFVFKPEYWNVYDEYYRRAIAVGCEVKVIPLPYYSVNDDGSFGELHYDTEGYPDYVTCVSYESYDVERLQPDYIFIQVPYDECNRAVSVPTYYYSSRLKSYTEKLVYVPYFKVDEVDNEKAWEMMEYYCTMPGVVHSDVVIVPSEMTRQSYIDRLTQMSGEEYRPVWEKKVCIGG